MSGKDDASVVSDYVDIMDKSLQYTEQDYIQCVESKDWEGEAPSWCLGASQASELVTPCMGPLSLPWGSWLTLGCVPRIRARGPVHGAPPVFLLVANWLYICGLHLETAAGMSVVGLADGGKEESRIVVTCWFVYWHSNAGKILHNSEDEAVHRPQGGPVKM